MAKCHLLLYVLDETSTFSIFNDIISLCSKFIYLDIFEFAFLQFCSDTRKENAFDNQCYNDVENKNSMNDKGSISEDNMNQNNSNPYENEHDETNNENSNEQDETYVNVELPRGIRVKDLESIIARKRADENAGFKEEYAVSFIILAVRYREKF